MGIKVAYLLGSLNRGGTETMVLDEFRNADKAPYEMICIHRKGGVYLEDYHATGIKMIQCAPKRIGVLRYLWQLRKNLLSEKVTIAHAQQSVDCIYAWFATIGTGIRVIETFHSYDIGLNRWNRWIRRVSIRMADIVCFVSKAQRDYYVKNYEIMQLEKLHVVYNGIDFAKFDSAKSIVDSRETSVKRGYRLCMVGNFVRGRSQLVVCKALHKLRVENRKSRVGFDFYFIGRKDEGQAWRYDECVTYCEVNGMSNVHFLGARSDVPAILTTMDGFVYSTVHDTFGIAVIEAMAAGLPIVVNDWNVMKEVCGEANDGIRFYKTGDAKDAADKIADLLVALPQSRRVAEVNAVRVREQYSILNHMYRLNEIYMTSKL